MTNVYSTACTPWFIAAQQAVPAGGAPVNLLGGTLKVGDGNGVVPTISQLIANGGVLHQVWAGAPNSVTIDATNTGQIDVGCLIPTVDGSGNEIGPFNVTEFAIYDATGNLAIVGTTNLQKTTSAQGQLMTLQWFACYIAAAANAVTLQPPAGSFPTLGQVQCGVAGLLSASAPLTVTPTLQSSGWTDWLISIANATLTALGVGRPATDAEFAAGAPAAGGYAFPWVQIEQVAPGILSHATVTISATANWTVPKTGWYWVECYSGGGGGGINQLAGASEGEGGGGGGYSGKWIYLVAGTVIRVTVGPGGVCNGYGSGAAGGTTSFGAYHSAIGGAPGTGGGSPGAGGYGVGGDINLTGQTGVSGNQVYGVQNGQGGDAAGPFGGKGAMGSDYGVPTWPGGGGFGASTTAGYYVVGTNGVAGGVIIRY